MNTITDSDRIAMCKACTLAECMKACKVCPFNIGLAQIAKKDAMDTIKLPDGYNGDMVECEREPIEVQWPMLKLQVKDSYMIRWCTVIQWAEAVYRAERENPGF